MKYGQEIYGFDSDMIDKTNLQVHLDRSIRSLHALSIPSETVGLV